LEPTCPNHPRRSVSGEEQGGERDERARDRPLRELCLRRVRPAEKQRVTELREERLYDGLPRRLRACGAPPAGTARCGTSTSTNSSSERSRDERLHDRQLQGDRGL